MFHYTPAPPKAHPLKINGLARYVANLFPPYCLSWVKLGGRLEGRVHQQDVICIRD